MNSSSPLKIYQTWFNAFFCLSTAGVSLMFIRMDTGSSRGDVGIVTAFCGAALALAKCLITKPD